MSDETPAGFARCSPEQTAILESTVSAAGRAAGARVIAVGVIVVFDDQSVMAGAAAGDASRAAVGFACLDLYGPNVLRVTMERMKQGKGHTKIIVRGAHDGPGNA